jgi:hypothetical protein
MGYSLQPHIRRQPGPSKPHTRLRQVSEAGLRYYSPSLGRWLSRDPLGDEAVLVSVIQGQRPEFEPRLRQQSKAACYLFVNNSPVESVDFLGLVNVDDSCGGWAGDIYNSFIDLCSSLRQGELNCCFGADATLKNWLQPLLKLCDNQTYRIRCASGKACDSKTHPGLRDCGFWQPPATTKPDPDRPIRLYPPGIYLCPGGIQGTAGCGGSTQCILLHEMVHDVIKSIIDTIPGMAEHCLGCSP